MKFFLIDLWTFLKEVRKAWKQFRIEAKYSRKMEKKEKEHGMIQCYLDDFESVLPDMEEQQIKLSLRMFLHFYGMVEDKHPQDLINEYTLMEYCEKYEVEFP